MNEKDTQKFLTKSGDPGISAAFDELFENDKGFISFRVTGDSLFIVQCYGDGRYWMDVARGVAKKLGLTKIQFTTRRNYRAFERRHGFKLIGYVMESEV